MGLEGWGLQIYAALCPQKTGAEESLRNDSPQQESGSRRPQVFLLFPGYM